MRVFCLYRPNSDHERSVIEFDAELNRRYNKNIEMISLDTKEGVRLAEVYDVLQLPSVVVTDSSGVLQQSWTNGQLPLLNEVSYYLDRS